MKSKLLKYIKSSVQPLRFFFYFGNVCKMRKYLKCEYLKEIGYFSIILEASCKSEKWTIYDGLL